MATPASRDDALNAATQALAAGDAMRAEILAAEILAATPNEARARVLRANALLKLERWRDAIPELELLIAAAPDGAQLRRLVALCWLRIGNASKAAGDNDGATAAYRRSIAAAPQLNDARHNLGTLLLTLDRPGEALPLLQAVAAAEPDNDVAILDLARALAAVGERESAVDRCAAIAARSRDVSVQQAAAELLLDLGDTQAAARAIERAIGIAPDRWPWVLAQTRRLRENADMASNTTVHAALAAQPLAESARLCLALHEALGLPSVYDSAEALAAARAGYARGLERLVVEYPPERVAAVAAASADLLRWDNFLLAYQGGNDRDLQQRFGDWYSAVLHALLRPERPRRAGPRSRPRIALVSGRWHHCTVGVYFAAWIDYLAAHGWDVVLVHAGAYRDAWTERLARAASGELTLTGSLADSAARIGELDADIVLYPELGMDSTVFALAALRLAPLQVCAWGHPTTTGLPTIDAFLSCADMEPVDGAEHYRERLLLLPGLGTRYPAPDLPPPAARGELGLPPAAPLYFVPQSAFKLHPDNDAVLCRIVENDTDAVLVLFADREPGATRRLRQRLRARLGAATAAPERRLLMLEQRPRADFLRVARACDVMVDSLHWSGGNTTLDALHCGLPVVTCPGSLMRGRQSMAMVQALAHPELVAATPESLAARACGLAHDGARAATGADLRERLPALTQSDAPLATLGRLLRDLITHHRSI